MAQSKGFPMPSAPDYEFEDFDDGASEVVSRSPQRNGILPIENNTIARSPAAGGIKRLLEKGESHRKDFILLRKVGAPPIKVAIVHMGLFKALWTLWEGKRISNEDDPGVAIAEISQHLSELNQSLATSSISSGLRSLVRNGVVRSVDRYVGMRGRRTRYYPTDAGVEAFALAEVLGDGTLLQIGGTARSWHNRAATEPINIFQHAALIRGLSPLADTM